MVFDAVMRFASDQRHDDRQRLVERMESSVIDIGVLYRALKAGAQTEEAPPRPSDADLLRLLEEAEEEPGPGVFQVISDRVVPPPTADSSDIKEAFDELSGLEGRLIEAERWAQKHQRPDLHQHLAAARNSVRREVCQLTDQLFDCIAVRADENMPTASVRPFPISAQ